jgi:hypothetical protein
MKTSTIWSFVTVVALATFSLSSCKKKDKEVEPDPIPVTPSKTDKAKQSDQAGSAAVDGAIDDVNDFVSNGMGGGSSKATSGARIEAYNLPCGIVSVDSTTTENGKKVYKMKYGKNTPCGYKRKSGTVAFQLISGNAFNEAGAKFKMTFTNYVVEILATNDSVKVNGFIIITNKDGGHIWEAVINGKTIVHAVRGTFSVTYTNGDVRERKYYQKRTWTNTTAGQWTGLKFSVEGDTTLNYPKVIESGYTYDGNNYYETQTTTPYSWSNCGNNFAGPYVLKTGKAKMNITYPLVSPTYIEVEAGYYWNYASATATATKVEDCTTNAYKIFLKFGTTEITQYQLY